MATTGTPVAGSGVGTMSAHAAWLDSGELLNSSLSESGIVECTDAGLISQLLELRVMPATGMCSGEPRIASCTAQQSLHATMHGMASQLLTCPNEFNSELCAVCYMSS